MISVIGASVNLIPDTTVFFQLIVFLVVVVVLTFLVFKPTLRILDKRHSRTTELMMHAEMLSNDANDMNRDYDETLTAARHESTAIQHKLIKEGEEEARNIIAAAKQEDKKTSASRHDYLLQESVRIKTDLARKVDDYTNLIIDKVLDKRTS